MLDIHELLMERFNQQVAGLTNLFHSIHKSAYNTFCKLIDLKSTSKLYSGVCLYRLIYYNIIVNLYYFIYTLIISA
jgi:hypothetical protein